METELKLSFSSKEEMDALWDMDWFEDLLIHDTAVTNQFDTFYLDTSNFALRKERAAARVRLINQHDYEHTVKISKAASNGLHQRLEWNYQASNDIFDSADFMEKAVSNGDPDDDLEEVLNLFDDEDLKEIFSTHFERLSSMAGYGDSLLEVAFDVGYLKAGDKKAPICEMEIELKEGDVRDVIALGEYILARTNATRENKGKYARCLEILE